MSLLGEGEGGGGGGVQEQRATVRIEEPQGGDRLCRGKWHTLDLVEIGRRKDTVGQGNNCAEIKISALFCLHLVNRSFLSLKIMI